MKKTYFAPATEVLQFETEQMIAATTDMGFNSELDNSNTVSADDILDKKSVDVWGDEN